MISPRIKDFLEAGVHFGHQTHRWNPKMKPFIFAARNGIYIIDLQKTVNALDQAKKKVREVVSNGRSILFVGTKKQAREVILEQSPRCKGFYVTERWLGGMLTNFATIKGSIKKLNDIEKMREDGTYEKITKKERGRLDVRAAKLSKVLAGIRDMNFVPGLVIIVDSKKEQIAVAEASKLGIPIIAIIDTNADPDPIDFPIAGNDDAIKSIRILLRELVDAAVDEQNMVAKSSPTVESASADEDTAKVYVDQEAQSNIGKKV